MALAVVIWFKEFAFFYFQKMREVVVVRCCFYQEWLQRETFIAKIRSSWFPSKTIADSQEVPTVSARGSIFVPVPLHIEEDDCPPNVVDVKQISSTAVCRSDEVKNFCDKLNVGSSSWVTCVAGASVWQ